VLVAISFEALIIGDSKESNQKYNEFHKPVRDRRCICTLAAFDAAVFALAFGAGFGFG
jgi:hypothetical protein